MDLGPLDEVLRALHADTERACLSACCALSVDVLFDLDAAEVHSALTAAFAVIEGGATFPNAKVLLAKLFSVRADVVSGPLEAMCRLNGTAGLVILGVDPSLLYPSATPGRHAILLASCFTSGLPVWATGFLGPVASGTPDPVTFLDPSRPVDPRHATSFSVLAAAFDRAGREALLVEHGRS
jgi:hypothetical protein